MGTAMERYLYFRTVADEDDDDAVADCIALPARQIVPCNPIRRCCSSRID